MARGFCGDGLLGFRSPQIRCLPYRRRSCINRATTFARHNAMGFENLFALTRSARGDLFMLSGYTAAG